MPLADFSTIDVLWIVLSAFLVVVGLALAFLLLRLSGTARRLTALLGSVETSIVPLVTKIQGTIDRVNQQLDKADVVTTSAIDAVDAADTAIRAVSIAVTRPVEKISGLARGTVVGVSTFFSGWSLDEALKAAREAKAKRQQEIADELRRPGPIDVG
jgi:hypothetical protein